MAAFAAPLIASAIPALAGLFGGGKQQQTNSSQNTSGNQNQFYSGRSSSNPQLNPFQSALASLFTRGTMDQYNRGTNMAPYTSQGLQGIQSQGTQNNKLISNILAQRGLSYSPAAATGLTQNALNTGNQMSGFLQSVPLLQHQLQQGNLDQLMKAFGTMPYGTTQDTSGQSQGTTQSNSTGTNTQMGNPLGGFFGGMGAGMFSPSGAEGSQSNLMSLLSQIFKPKNQGGYVRAQPRTPDYEV